MGTVQTPTLILWGDQDRFDPASMADRIPGSTAHVLPGCGHNVHQDCPGQANPLIATFLTHETGGSREAGSPPTARKE